MKRTSAYGTAGLLLSHLLLLSTGVAAEDTASLATGTFKFADIDVHYKMYDQPKADTPFVLFLHGVKYTSQDWVDIGMLQSVHEAGYRALAVDIPGFGKTPALPYHDNNMRAEFVKASLEFGGRGANVTNSGAVLVSPSMSGKWSIPFLDRYGLMLKGWVAVAPVGVSQWGGPWEYTHKKVSLLAVYGENDSMASQADMLMQLFQSSKKYIINDASHACYMDQPKLFMTRLLEFVKDVIHEANPVLFHHDP